MTSLVPEPDLKRLLLMALLVAVALLMVESFVLGLYHEEPRRLLVADAMLQQGEWVVPHILGETYLKKPPGYNWAVALLSVLYGGVSALSGRIVAVISWLGLGILVWWLTDDFERRIHRAVAIISVLFCLTMFVEKAAFAEIDLYFSFLLTAGVCAFYWGINTENAFIGVIVSHLFLALALLTKGPVAYLFFYGPLVCLSLGDRVTLKWRDAFLGFLLAHVLVFMWLWGLLTRVDPSRFLEVISSETMGRTGIAAVENYLVKFLKMPVLIFFAFAPSTFFLAYLTVTDDVADAVVSFWNRDLPRMALGGLMPLIVFWLLPVDSVRYVLPTVPWAAVLVGSWLERLEDPGLVKSMLNVINGVFGGLFVLMVSLPWVLDADGSLLSSTTVTVVSLALSLVGVVVLLVPYLPGDTGKNAFSTLITLFFVIKIGYLFVYVPVEKPERLTVKPRLERFAGAIRSTVGQSPVIHNSDNGLVIAYYFQNEGIKIRKKTTGDLSGNKYVVTKNKDDLDSRWTLKHHLRLSDEDVFYFHVPSKL